MKIYLVRHGMPVGAEKGPRYLGFTDEPLCEEGKNQASETGQMILQMDPLSRMRIAASPLKRAAETAEIIREYVCCGPVETNAGLREINLGAWDGKYVSEIMETHPEEYEARGRDLLNYRIPGGETFAETGARFRDAAEEIIRSSEPGEDIIIVTHAGAMRSGISLMTGIPFEELATIKIPYAGVIALNCECTENNGLSFSIGGII